MQPMGPNSPATHPAGHQDTPRGPPQINPWAPNFHYIADSIKSALGRRRINRVLVFGLGPLCDTQGHINWAGPSSGDDMEGGLSYRQWQVSCALLHHLQHAHVQAGTPPVLDTNYRVGIFNMNDNLSSQRLAWQMARVCGLPPLSCHRTLLDRHLFHARGVQHEPPVFASELAARNQWLQVPSSAEHCTLVFSWRMGFDAIHDLLSANQGRLEQFIFVGVALPHIGSRDSQNSRNEYLEERFRDEVCIMPELQYHYAEMVNQPIEVVVYSNAFHPQQHDHVGNAHFLRKVEADNLRAESSEWQEYVREVRQGGAQHPAHHTQ